MLNRFSLKYAKLVAKECYRGYRVARLKSLQGDNIRYWQELRTFSHSISQDCYGKNVRTLQPFDQHRCIYVHIPKTGGQSISTSLFGSCTGRHCTVAEYKQIFGERVFKDYLKFTFVRNPWDRLVSTYHFHQNGNIKAQFRRWGAEHISPYRDFGSFVRGFINPESIYEHNILVPQHEYLCDEAGRLAVDFVGYHENRAADYTQVRQKLGNIGTDMNHLNSSRRLCYSHYYSDETREIVARAYRKDIELFGYEFESAAHEPQRAAARN